MGVGCLLESNYSKGEPKSLFFLRDIMMCKVLIKADLLYSL